MKRTKDYNGVLEIQPKSKDEADDRENHSSMKYGRQEHNTKYQKKADLYKPPTNDELNSLQETEKLYQSNIFRMQVKELLGEVVLKDSKKKRLDEFLHSLNQKLMKLKQVKVNDVTDKSWLPGDIEIPMKLERSQVKGKLVFSKPSSVKVVGSYLLGTAITPVVNVDLAVMMPQGFIVPKDHRNFRYHHKRALYLAYIAAKMYQCEEVDELKYRCTDHMKPILTIKPHGKLGKFATINIRPSLQDGTFQVSNLQPSNGHISKKWFNCSKQQNTPDNFPASPHYNSTILSDLHFELHLRILYEAARDFPGMNEGIILMKVWLHQRQLDQGFGCLSGFIISMLVVHLLNVKKLNKLMSAYQVFRNTLHFLASTNWTECGVAMAVPLHDNHPPLAHFHDHFEVVFIDSTGCHNICADVNQQIYLEVRKEAELAILLLDDKVGDSFHCLFMTSVSFSSKYDHIFHISKPGQLQAACQLYSCEDQCMDLGGNFVQASIWPTVQYLKDALDKRIHFIGLKAAEPKQWSLSESPPDLNTDHVTFGLQLNTQFSSSVLDKGPQSDTQLASVFRKFWGDKAEMRRFQDGSICEAVVWPGQSVAEKRLVCSHIVKHTLERYVKLDPECIVYIGGQLDCLLKPMKHGAGKDSKSLPRGTGEEQNVAIIQVYDALSKQLRALKNLPLAITSVQGVSPVFRYSEVFPALPAVVQSSKHKIHKYVHVPSAEEACPHWVPVLSVLIQLEGSGRWPSDVQAVRRIKAAFHIKLGELLHKQFNFTTYPTATHVDVLKEGFVFRLKVAHRREIVLLKEVSDATGLLMHRDNAKSQELEKLLVHLPRLTTALNGLRQQFNSFGPTVRMCKRWVSAQLMSNHITEECIELMVAHLFLYPSPYLAPSLPLVGLQRFLHLLGNHDWNSSPLIINFNNELTITDYESVRNYFSNNRTHIPVMYLATAWDREESVWTKNTPTIQVLHRLILLAKESVSMLEKGMMSPSASTAEFKQIFRSPLDAYDVLIYLKHENLPRRHQSIDYVKRKSVARQQPPFLSHNPPMPVLDFDPAALYLQELTETFREFALFFHDVYGGDVVAVIWKPFAFDPLPFKVLKISARHCKDNGSKNQRTMTIPNIEAIIEDFKILGRGLVDRVEAKTENWII